MLLPLPAGALAALALAATDPTVAEGLGLYQRLKYDEAAIVLERARKRSDLERDDRVEALETLGFAYAVLNDAARAEGAFHELLDLVPGHELDPSLSPRLRSAFAQAKSSWLEGRIVTFVVTSPDGDVALTGALRDGDPRRVGAVILRDATGQTSPLACIARDCRGERPEAQFWVDVFDHRHALLTTAGPFAGAEPRGLPWWLWAAIAAGVAGGITIGAVAASGPDAPDGSLGRWQLP
ncbi:hypothetical protein L6R52_20470 [Myxococcota bacterium]|nr:hypothetical protein [Myxococcota bacterium]